MSYNFTKVAVTAHYDVKVDPAASYGYFEHHTLGDLQGGGLWFKTHESSTQGDEGRVLELIDFDGTYELPHEVFHALRHMGYVVDDIFSN